MTHLPGFVGTTVLVLGLFGAVGGSDKATTVQEAAAALGAPVPTGNEKLIIDVGQARGGNDKALQAEAALAVLALGRM